MTQHNFLNIKLSNSQLNKLESAMENGTDVPLNLSSNLIEVLIMKLILHTNYY